MQKVDIAIGVLGAVALLATGLGIAFYDEINDHHHYTVVSTSQEFGNDGAAPVEWNFAVPDNAYHAMFDVDFTFSAQDPSVSGDVNVIVTVTTPDGTEQTFEETFDFGAGSGTMSVSTYKWAEPIEGEEFTGSHDDVDAATLTWDNDLLVSISVQGPSSALPITVPTTGATYNADLNGDFHLYSLVPDTPEVETA